MGRSILGYNGSCGPFAQLSSEKKVLVMVLNTTTNDSQFSPYAMNRFIVSGVMEGCDEPAHSWSSDLRVPMPDVEYLGADV